MYKYRNTILCVTLFFCFPSFSANGETIKIEYKSSKVEKMQRHHIEGETPKVLLWVPIEGEPENTSYFILDFSDMDSGFKKNYTGSRLAPLSPCFGGIGVFEGWREICLLDMISGTKGQVLCHKTFIDNWLCKNELLFIAYGKGGCGIYRYDFDQGVLLEYSLKLIKPQRVDENLVLAIIRSNEKEQIVLIDIDKFEATILTDLPMQVKAKDIHCIYPAGAQCKGGVYFTTNKFSLFWKSPHAELKKVVNNVPITQKLGSSFKPWLPAAYVGEGRFAIAEWVSGSIKLKSKTLLIDGNSGKVLEETKVIVYESMPILDIPSHWWKAGEKPEEERGRNIGKYFHWDEKHDNILNNNDKIIIKNYTPRSQGVTASADGRYLVIYDRKSEPCNLGECLNMRIVDGAAGKEKIVTFSSKTRVGTGSLKSFLLYSESSNPGDLSLK